MNRNRKTFFYVSGKLGTDKDTTDKIIHDIRTCTAWSEIDRLYSTYGFEMVEKVATILDIILPRRGDE